VYWNSYYEMDSIVTRTPAQDYLVIDDVQWESLTKFYKGIVGAQTEVTLTDKYRKKTRITWGCPCIILCNRLPLWQDRDWIDRNLVIVGLLGKLFSADQ